jgi:hypothetical protein
MVRPSSLSLAERCELAPILAAEFPETNENIERGNLVDREVARELLGGDAATDPDAVACMDYLRSLGIAAPDPEPDGAFLSVQESISVTDPKSGEEITRGTPDIVFIAPDVSFPAQKHVIVVDLKKREQYFAGRLPDVERSLQLHAYALAWAIRSGASSYKICYLLFGDGDATAVWSPTFVEATWVHFLDRLRRIAEKCNANAVGGHRPPPTAGPHCTQCYQRLHCPSWLLPAHQGEGALVPLSRPGGLTTENAGAALLTVMAIEEAAERARALLKDFATVNGPIVLGDRQWGPSLTQGRRSGPSIQELEALNLMHLIKPGKPFLQWRLTKRRE